MESPRFGSARAALAVAFALTVLCGCSGRESATHRDTTIAQIGTPQGLSSDNVLAAVWDTAAGSLFAIPGRDPGDAYVIDPTYADEQRLDTLHVERSSGIGMVLNLYVADDSVGVARIATVIKDSTDHCPMWPRARLVAPDAGAITRPWSIAFPPGRVRGVRFDSLPVVSHGDSLRLTIAIARAASKTPGDTAAAFRGRPYVVRQANIFRLPTGQPVVLAEVLRLVNQEANPEQEQLVLVLEPDKDITAASFTVGYAERSIGLEETLASVDLISPIVLQSGTAALLVRREVGDGSRLILLERLSPGRWAVRWRSAYAGC
jgi:hypothetical protein